MGTDAPHARLITACSMPLSGPEREYLTAAIAADCRADGRRRLDARPLSLTTSLLGHTSGSAKLKMGGTEVLAGVKVEVGTPLSTQPNKGHALVSVDCCASAGGKELDALSAQVAAMVEASLKNSGIDWTSACLVEGKACWIFFVDLVVLQCDGNLFDACSIAALAALHSSAIPSVEVSVDPSSNELMLEVDDDQSNATNLDLTNAALLVSVHSIGGWSVLDTTLEEQECSEALLVVACGPDTICGIHKGGTRGIKPDQMFEMCREAQGFGQLMRTSMLSFLNDEKKNPASCFGASSSDMFF